MFARLALQSSSRIHDVCVYIIQEILHFISVHIGSTKLTDKDDFGGTALQEAIDIAYKETSRYLLEILVSKYKFVDHLKVIKLFTAYLK